MAKLVEERGREAGGEGHCRSSLFSNECADWKRHHRDCWERGVERSKKDS